MNAIVNTGPGRLEWLELPRPDPGLGQVRIKTRACGICATDLEMIKGWPRTSFPAIPGHEWSGSVDAVGPGVAPDLAGHPCVADNILADGGEVGFEHPGGYAEYFITEAKNLQFLPGDFSPATATLIEPLAVCLRALGRMRPGDRSSALVIGDGPIGLIILILLAGEGVGNLVMLGGRPGRLNLGREFGAHRVINYHELKGDLAEAVGNTVEHPFANVIEASGSAAALSAGIKLAAAGGKVLVVGDYKDSRADFQWNTVLHKELEIIGSSTGAGAWAEAVRVAQTSRALLDKLITHQLPAARFKEAVEIADSCREAIKVVMRWDD